jgi:hypothetical protein
MIVYCPDIVVFDLITNIYPVSGACSIEFFVASKDQFRVAPALKIPCPWPYEIHRASNQAQELLESLENAIKKVLRENNVQLHYTRTMALCRKGEGDTPLDTLILVSEDDDTRNWKAAVTIIGEMIDNAARKLNGSPTIRVEIRNEDLMYRDISYVIKPETVEHRACMELEDLVFDQVKKSCPSDWTSICYFMRGRKDHTEASRKLTLVVGIKPRQRSLWAFVEEQIGDAVQSLKKSDVDIYIELLPSRVHLLVDHSQPASKEMKPVAPEIHWNAVLAPPSGASIGPRLSQDAGTLGTWVSFRGLDGVKQVCFLTCCHVISPGDPGNRTTVERHGIALNGRKAINPIFVDYPAPFDTAATKVVLSSRISRGEDDEGTMKKSLDVIEKHISNGGIGTALHASGTFRTNINERRMDWALVRCQDPSTIGKNMPSPGPFNARQLGNRQVPYFVKPGEIVQKSNSLIDGMWVTKKGRTSGVTTGEVHAMRAIIDWQNGMITREIIILGFGDDFVEPGDSGAMVTNLDKEWVGMVIGKDSYTSYGIVTSVTELRSDIDQGTGGSISLL